MAARRGRPATVAKCAGVAPPAFERFSLSYCDRRQSKPFAEGLSSSDQHSVLIHLAHRLVAKRLAGRDRSDHDADILPAD